MKRIFVAALFAACAASQAVERRELASVPIAAFVKETQQMQDQGGGLALVWWIPTEFWVAAVLQNNRGNDALVREIRAAFARYVLLGVVEGRGKALGGLDFVPRASVESRLKAHAGGAEYVPVSRPHKDAQLVTESMKPILTSMLGELGAHFHLILLASDQRDPPSPYEPGTLRVTLAAEEGGVQRSFAFDAPLDALHVPRTCPNGRPAHVSWRFCPWDGSRLGD